MPLTRGRRVGATRLPPRSRVGSQSKVLADDGLGLPGVSDLDVVPPTEAGGPVHRWQPEGPGRRHLGRLVPSAGAGYLDDQVEVVVRPTPVVDADDEVREVSVLLAVD